MRAVNGGVELEWDERGPADGDPLLLVMGLGAQLTAWQDGFCDLLVDAGHRVIRFDNRDSGLSSFTPGPRPTFADMAAAYVRGARHRAVRYTLSDMAADGMAVLDAAGVERAHVVGASLGGMIAQTIAIEHPHRVASLTSIMSKTGALLDGLPTPTVLRKVMQPTPIDPEAAQIYELERAALTCGPLYDPEAMAASLLAARDRSPDRGAMAHQLTAIFASGSRRRALRTVAAPTLVIHGLADGLIGPSGGRATATAVPGAQLRLFEEMGHDLPRALWPDLTGAIVEHAAAARGSRAPRERSLAPLPV